MKIWIVPFHQDLNTPIIITWLDYVISVKNTLHNQWDFTNLEFYICYLCQATGAEFYRIFRVPRTIFVKEFRSILLSTYKLQKIFWIVLRILFWMEFCIFHHIFIFQKFAGSQSSLFWNFDPFFCFWSVSSFSRNLKLILYKKNYIFVFLFWCFSLN